MKGITYYELKNSPTKQALEATTIERDNLRNEIATLKSQLAQKDTTISSLTSQANNSNSWKSSYDSAQYQVNNLRTLLNQSKTETQLLKQQLTEKNKLIQDSQTLLNQSKAETQLLKQQLIEENKLTQDSQTLLNQVQNLNIEIDRLKKVNDEFIAEKSKPVIKQPSEDNVKELQLKLTLAEDKVNFMTKFFDETKQEKKELKKELNLYKKSFVKKHDLSVSQSIEIDKLRKEMLENSRSKIDNFSGQEDDINPDFEQSYIGNVLDTHTTLSQLVDTQEITQYIKNKKESTDSVMYSIIEPIKNPVSFIGEHNFQEDADNL